MWSPLKSAVREHKHGEREDEQDVISLLLCVLCIHTKIWISKSQQPGYIYVVLNETCIINCLNYSWQDEFEMQTQGTNNTSQMTYKQDKSYTMPVGI